MAENDINQHGGVRVPRFLQKVKGERSLSVRPALPIDNLEEDGTALDTVHHSVTYRLKMYRQTRRRLAEMEELRTFAREKDLKGIQKEKLEAILKEN